METMYDDRGELVYLYRIIDGICTRSQALAAALKAGLPEQVIQRAYEVCKSFLNETFQHRNSF